MYRILAIANDKFGCGKFRTFDPFKCISEEYGDEFKVDTMLLTDLPDTLTEVEKVFKQYDMLHFHKLMDKDLKLITLAKKCNLVVVCDVDDHWNLGDYHPMSKTSKRENWAKPIIEHLHLSDYVTTTTKYLANEVKKYNKNVFVVPNAVNPDEEQFSTPYKEGKRLRFGIICGSSHLNDLKEMEGFIKQIPQEILEKCQFVLCGFDTNGKMTIYDRSNNTYRQIPINPAESTWAEYERIITDNYSIVSPMAKHWLTKYIKAPYCGDEQYLRCWTKDIDHYATHYDDIDVLLVPLKDCQFNLAKCVVGNTKVATDKGIFKIKDLFDNMLKNNVHIDDKEKPIINFFKSEEVPTLKLTTSKGYEIEGTFHHKLMKNGEWTEIQDFSVGDEIEMEKPMILSVEKVKISDDEYADELFMNIIGLMYGYYHKNKFGFALSTINDDIEDASIIREMLESKNLVTEQIKSLCDKDITKEMFGEDDMIVRKTFSRITRIYKMFHVQEQRSLPTEIFKMDKNCIKSFVDGFLKLNSVDIVGTRHLYFKNKQTMLDMQYLMLCLGLSTKVLTNKELIMLSDDDISDENPKFTDKIISIKMGENKVYDITVDEIHMYNANGFISHNSQLKVIEAGFKHKAIIAEEVGPYKIDLKPMIEKGGNINEEGNALLVNPSKTHKQWAKYITYLANNPDKVKLLQDNLYNTVKDKYNLSNVTRGRVEIYRNILKNKVNE